MPKTLSALVVAVGIVGFAGAAAAAGCGGYATTAESTPVVTAEAGQSTPVIKTTTTKETAKN